MKPEKKIAFKIYDTFTILLFCTHYYYFNLMGHVLIIKERNLNKIEL